MFNWSSSDWMSEGLCRKWRIPNDLFFPNQVGVTSIPSIIAMACAACPVAGECADYQRATSSQGIWAGVMFGSRQPKQRQLAPCGTDAARRRHRHNVEACATCRYTPRGLERSETANLRAS